jgi:hypothetical protein
VIVCELDDGLIQNRRMWFWLIRFLSSDLTSPPSTGFFIFIRPPLGNEAKIQVYIYTSIGIENCTVF